MLCAKAYQRTESDAETVRGAPPAQGVPWATGATGGNVALMQEEVSAQEALRQEELLRRKNRRAAVYRQRRIRVALAFAAVVLVVLGIIIAVAANRSTTQVGTEALLAGGARSPSAPVAASAGDYPAFARLGDRNLLLPVKADDATIIAYQPVSDERAVALTPIGQKANANALIRFFRGIFSTDPSVRYYLLEGGAGEPTSSVLIGAAPGSPVYAPISGVVTRVNPYKLYGKYDDVQIDIRPEKMGGVTVSLLFISDPAVSIGETVTAGKTALGAVRQCPETLAAGLSEYTHDSGAHVHLQVMGGADQLNARYCSKCGGAVEMQPVGDRPREVCSICGEIFYQNPLPAAAALVLDADRRVLLVRRKFPPNQGHVVPTHGLC